jgi:hypothetical protein
MPRSKGHSLAEWVITLSVIVVITLFVLTTTKRTLVSKAMSTANYFVWTMWGDSVSEDDGYDKKYSADSTFSDSKNNQLLENAGDIRAIVDSRSAAHTSSTYRP